MAVAAIYNLRGAELFGSPLEITHSKHSHIVFGQFEYDGSQRDYSTSPLQRVSMQNMHNDKHVCRPTQTLHVSNFGLEVTPNALTSHFHGHGTGPIRAVKVFQSRATGRPMALLGFFSVNAATDALALLHNSSLNMISTIKVAFSKNF